MRRWDIRHEGFTFIAGSFWGAFAGLLEMRDYRAAGICLAYVLLWGLLRILVSDWLWKRLEEGR